MMKLNPVIFNLLWSNAPQYDDMADYRVEMRLRYFGWEAGSQAAQEVACDTIWRLRHGNLKMFRSVGVAMGVPVDAWISGEIVPDLATQKLLGYAVVMKRLMEIGE